MRDPNLRMLMSNICEDSPMYDYVEQIAGRTVKSETNSNSQPKEQKEESKKRKKAAMPEESALTFDEVMLGKDFKLPASLHESQAELARMKLSNEEVSARY